MGAVGQRVSSWTGHLASRLPNDLEDEDKAENDESVKDGSRILSAYRLPDGEKIWIITDAFERSTAVLLPLTPSEY